MESGYQVQRFLRHTLGASRSQGDVEKQHEQRRRDAPRKSEQEQFVRVCRVEVHDTSEHGRYSIRHCGVCSRRRTVSAAPRNFAGITVVS